MLMGRQRTEFRSRSNDFQVELARCGVSAHDSDWPGMACTIIGDIGPSQKSCESLDRIERGRKADTGRSRRPASSYQSVEALQRQHQMGAPFVAGHCVQFVDDDITHRAELLAETR